MGRRGASAAAGSARRHAALAGTICALALAAAGCDSVGANQNTGSPSTTHGVPAGRVLLAVPVELRQTLREYPCSEGRDAPTSTAAPQAMATGGLMAPAIQSPMTGNVRDLDGADCFDLSQPLLTLQRLDSIGVANTSADDDWVINLGLTPADARSLAGLTVGRTGEQLAVVVRGTVLATPEVDGQGAAIQISGDFSQDDARRLMRQITG